MVRVMMVTGRITRRYNTRMHHRVLVFAVTYTTVHSDADHARGLKRDEKHRDDGDSERTHVEISRVWAR